MPPTSILVLHWFKFLCFSPKLWACNRLPTFAIIYITALHLLYLALSCLLGIIIIFLTLIFHGQSWPITSYKNLLCAFLALCCCCCFSWKKRKLSMLRSDKRVNDGGGCPCSSLSLICKASDLGWQFFCPLLTPNFAVNTPQTAAVWYCGQIQF